MVVAYPDFLVEGRGVCRLPGVNPDLFTDNGERGATRVRRVRLAKAVCDRCAWRVACELFALQTGQVGVWGGKTDEERAGVRSHA